MGKGSKVTPRAHEGAEAAAVWVGIGELHAWELNPRKNDGEPVRKVAESIKRFGFASPIIARTNGEVIAGHTRLKAAKELGLDRVPVRYMDLDPAEAHLLALADNRLNEEAEWDFALLSNVLKEFDLNDLVHTGFDDFELEPLMLADWAPPTPSPADADPHEDLESDTRSLKVSERQWERIAAAIALARKQAETELPDGEAVAKVADWFVGANGE